MIALADAEVVAETGSASNMTAIQVRNREREAVSEGMERRNGAKEWRGGMD